MNLLFRRPCIAKDATVEALFAENLSAHERAGAASDDMAQRSERSRLWLLDVRAEIAERTATDRRTRPHPHTSDVRAAIEGVLSRPGLRGLPSDRDPS